MFHNETWGGEKFFVLLSRLTDRPGNNRDLLELLYVCLALGFEGRYRVLQNGKSQLEAVREHGLSSDCSIARSFNQQVSRKR